MKSKSCRLVTRNFCGNGMPPSKVCVEGEKVCPIDGDSWVDNTEGKYYVRRKGNWVECQVGSGGSGGQGPTGPTGPTGSGNGGGQGPTGPTGPTGSGGGEEEVIRIFEITDGTGTPEDGEVLVNINNTENAGFINNTGGSLYVRRSGSLYTLSTSIINDFGGGIAFKPPIDGVLVFNLQQLAGELPENGEEFSLSVNGLFFPDDDFGNAQPSNCRAQLKSGSAVLEIFRSPTDFTQEWESNDTNIVNNFSLSWIKPPAP